MWRPSLAHLLVHVRDRGRQLQSVKQVVAVVIMHLEVMQLQLLRRHVRLWFFYDAFQVLHDVTNEEKTG